MSPALPRLNEISGNKQLLIFSIFLLAKVIGLIYRENLTFVKCRFFMGKSMKSPSDKSGLKIADKWSDLLRLYKTDMSMREIAEHLQVGLTSLYSKVKELGLKRTPRRKKKPIDIKLFKELVKLGVPRMEVAKRVGVTYQYLNVYIQKNNFENRPYIRRSVFDGYDEELMQMRKDKMTLEQIGKRFGVGITAVLHRIKKLQQNNQYQNI